MGPNPACDDCRSEVQRLRRQIVEALWAAGGGHYGGALSVVDILQALYRHALRIQPDAPDDPGRDRLIFSKGHAAIALYAMLRSAGYFDDDLAGYGSSGSPLEGHPDMAALPGVDFSSGSLGQGLSVALGMAVALRSHGARVWAVLGDGECQEGQVWEAAMLAARLGVGNLVAVVDANGHQEWGWPAGTAMAGPPVAHLGDKWGAFGWRVIDVDGHDHDALVATYESATRSAGPPVVVIAHTVKGRGFTAVEADPLRFHCTEVTREEHRRLLAEAPG